MPLTSLPKHAAMLELGVLRAAEMQGFSFAICVLGIAVPAIGFKLKDYFLEKLLERQSGIEHAFG